MHIAIFGSTSQIAKDLIELFNETEHQLTLFARRPAVVETWLTSINILGRYPVHHFDDFSHELAFDAIINFVGVGNPAQAAAMGATIFDATLIYDQLALNYLQAHPTCKYLFLSSGAVYGGNFDEPVDHHSIARTNVNNLKPQDWYGAAKLHAECRHRALNHLSIIDIRVFNYVSRTQDLSARFLITDIFRAIRNQERLECSDENIVRDFIHPSDFFVLVNILLSTENLNTVVDCYSKAPIDKLTLLEVMREKFGLQFATIPTQTGVDATGAKRNYYSLNKLAGKYGYEPVFTSLLGIQEEFRALLKIN